MNTETVAFSIYDAITNTGVFDSIEIKSMSELYDLNELQDYSCIIIGTSTWSDGAYPPDTEDFLNNLEEKEDINLEGKSMAFFGLGESHYEDFCGAINRLRDYFVNKKKVNQLGTIHYIDGFPEDDILHAANAWSTNVISG